MVELLLGGDPLATFREIRMVVTMPIDIDEDAELVENEDTFVSCMNRFYSHYFPKFGNSSRRQKKYLMQYLRKPRQVLIKQMIARLKQVNAFLSYFPSPDNQMFD